MLSNQRQISGMTAQNLRDLIEQMGPMDTVDVVAHETVAYRFWSARTVDEVTA